jgi:lysophospholipase L1-like esterase
MAAILLLCSLVLSAPVAPSKRPVTYATPEMTRHFQGKTVLFVGDSMIVTGLDIWARHWVQRNGGTYRRYYHSSSTTRSWATTRALEYALGRYKPHIVFIVLGSNELYISKPQQRARYVRTILKKLGKRPYRWIGPPSWAPDTGIIKVLARTVPAGRFYPFNGRRIGRSRDGKHPSIMGSKTWARDIFNWYAKRLKKEGRP